MNFSRSELLELFFEEVQSYISPMRENLGIVRASKDMAAAGELHRLFHNVKGAASQVQLVKLSGGARVVEQYLAGIVEEGHELDGAGLESVGRAVDLLEVFAETGSADPRVEERFCTAVSQMDWPAGVDGGKVDELSLADIRSVFPFLHELVECLGSDADHRVENLQVYRRFATALASLVDMARALGLEAQGKLLRAFSDLVESLTEGGNPYQDEIVGILGDFLSFMELAFDDDRERRDLALGRIETQLQGIRRLCAVPSPVKDEVEEEDPEDSWGDPLFDDQDDLSLPLIDRTESEDGNFGSGSSEAEQGVKPEVFDVVREDLGSASVPDAEGGPESAGGDPLALKGGGGVLAFDDPDREALAAIFKEECEVHFITIHSSLNELEKKIVRAPDDHASLLGPLGAIRRAVHTLKGAASITGVDLLAEGAHSLEDMLDWLHENPRAIEEEDIQFIAVSAETLESLAAFADERQIRELRANIDGHLAEKKRAVSSIHAIPASEDEIFALLAEAEHGYQQGTSGTLAEETGSLRVRLGDLDELLSVEGELVVARVAIEKKVSELDLALHNLEAVKDNLRKKCQELESGFEVKALYSGKSAGPVASLPFMDGSGQGDVRLEEFDPLELDRYSELNLLIRSLNEIAVDINSIHATLNSLSGDIGGQAAKQQFTMREMQEKLMRIRMIPLSSLSRTFHTTVRSAAASLGKVVDFDIVGEDVYMDRYVWTMVTDPLVHMLRNAVDHGIEPADERSRRGKTERGRITLSAEQRSRHVVLNISDDGAGVDLEAVRKTATASGRVAGIDELGESELLERIFYPGFSTRTDVSALSGRGVGLDIVRKNITDLRGSLQVHNSPGEGLRFEIHIPFSLSVNRAVLVRVADRLFALPIQEIDEIRRVTAEDIRAGDEPALYAGDEFIPFASLASYVEIAPPQADSSGVAILISLADAGGVERGRRMALGVSEIVEQREIVVKGLGTHLTHVPGVAGVTVTGAGELIPILNLRELVSLEPSPESMGGSAEEEQSASETFRVLIVDDSVSVRYSIARLVEAQGWEQKQAVDGVDALNVLETFIPDIIILDIEMPRMNGYELKSNLNNRADMQDIPVVMLTSRVSEKHRLKAKELGIDHYLNKPYDEDGFIRLLGNIMTGRG